MKEREKEIEKREGSVCVYTSSALARKRERKKDERMENKTGIRVIQERKKNIPQEQLGYSFDKFHKYKTFSVYFNNILT